MTCSVSSLRAFVPPRAELTPDEAVDIARSVARRLAWPWEGSPRVWFLRLVARRPEWRVQVGRVYVIIDDASGHPFIKALLPEPKWQRRRAS